MLRNLIVAMCLVFASLPAAAQNLDPENTLLMQLDGGTVVIRLRPNSRPTMWRGLRS